MIVVFCGVCGGRAPCLPKRAPGGIVTHLKGVAPGRAVTTISRQMRCIVAAVIIAYRRYVLHVSSPVFGKSTPRTSFYVRSNVMDTPYAIRTLMSPARYIFLDQGDFEYIFDECSWNTSGLQPR